VGIVQAAILGIVQGLTEFLPVSSSGHLAIIGRLFPGHTGKDVVSFVVAVHFASLAAILTVLWRDVRRLFTTDRRLLGLLALGTLPLVVLGKLVAGPAKAMFQIPLVPGIALIVTAAFLLIGDRLATERTEARQAKWYDPLVVGLAQVVAMVPGMSRSGFTISAGLICGLKRQDAVRFSFLLAVPAIVLATVYEVYTAYRGAGWAGLNLQWGPMVAGMLASYVFSVLAIRVMLKRVGRTRLAWFAGYCLLAAVAAIVLALVVQRPSG